MFIGGETTLKLQFMDEFFFFTIIPESIKDMKNNRNSKNESVDNFA